MNGHTSAPMPPELHELAAGINLAIAETERMLLGSALAHPLRESCTTGIRTAAAAGIKSDDFDDDSLAVVYLVASQGHHYPLPVVLGVAMRMLALYQLPMTDMDLVGLACSWPSPSFTAVFAERLKMLRRRRDEARAGYRRVIALLTPGVDT